MSKNFVHYGQMHIVHYYKECRFFSVYPLNRNHDPKDGIGVHPGILVISDQQYFQSERLRAAIDPERYTFVIHGLQHTREFEYYCSTAKIFESIHAPNSPAWIRRIMNTITDMNTDNFTQLNNHFQGIPDHNGQIHVYRDVSFNSNDVPLLLFTKL
jgi:hypothetical protein